MSRSRRRNAVVHVLRKSPPVAPVAALDLAGLDYGTWEFAADEDTTGGQGFVVRGGAVKPRSLLHRMGRLTGLNWFRDRRLIRLPRE